MSEGRMESFPEEDLWVSPVKFENGLLSKYGTAFSNRDAELQQFQKNFSVHLPEDFLTYIGEFCEAGFDGWYRVLKLKSEYIVWSHLFLMRKPQKTDSGIAKYAVENILRNKSLFFSKTGESLRYFPFGSAVVFSTVENRSVDGYLAFDTFENYTIEFVGESRHEFIASSFKAMIENAEFIHFG